MVFSTDFDNFYPSFDAPVVAEMAVQEFLRSGLHLEVDSRELSLYQQQHPGLETRQKTCNHDSGNCIKNAEC